jgi:hypothetical protein
MSHSASNHSCALIGQIQPRGLAQAENNGHGAQRHQRHWYNTATVTGIILPPSQGHNAIDIICQYRQHAATGGTAKKIPHHRQETLMIEHCTNESWEYSLSSFLRSNDLDDADLTPALPILDHKMSDERFLIPYPFPLLTYVTANCESAEHISLVVNHCGKKRTCELRHLV